VCVSACVCVKRVCRACVCVCRACVCVCVRASSRVCEKESMQVCVQPVHSCEEVYSKAEPQKAMVGRIMPV